MTTLCPNCKAILEYTLKEVIIETTKFGETKQTNFQWACNNCGKILFDNSPDAYHYLRTGETPLNKQTIRRGV